MAELSIAIGQCPADLSGPQERLSWLRSALNDLLTETPDLLVLPELFQSGYNIGARVKQLAEPVDGPFFHAIAELARQWDIAILYGFAERDGEQLYNAAQCVDRSGRRIGHHRKLILPPGYEGDHFTPGRRCSSFELAGFKLAILVCYDVEFPENLRQVVSLGADVVIVPTALGAQWGVVAHQLVPTRAFENGSYLCYANYSGNERGMDFLGASCIVSPSGQTLARAGDQAQLISAKLELDQVTSARERLPYQQDRLQLPWVCDQL